MFLYNKRTRKVIKYFWGFFAILIIASMVVTYSGFSRLGKQQAVQQPLERVVAEQPIIIPVSGGTTTITTGQNAGSVSVQSQKPVEQLRF